MKSSPPVVAHAKQASRLVMEKVKTDKSTGIAERERLGWGGGRPVQQATEPVVCTLYAVRRTTRSYAWKGRMSPACVQDETVCKMKTGASKTWRGEHPNVTNRDNIGEGPTVIN